MNKNYVPTWVGVSAWLVLGLVLTVVLATREDIPLDRETVRTMTHRAIGYRIAQECAAFNTPQEMHDCINRRLEELRYED